LRLHKYCGSVQKNVRRSFTAYIETVLDNNNPTEYLSKITLKNDVKYVYRKLTQGQIIHNTTIEKELASFVDTLHVSGDFLKNATKIKTNTKRVPEVYGFLNNKHKVIVSTYRNESKKSDFSGFWKLNKKYRYRFLGGSKFVIKSEESIYVSGVKELTYKKVPLLASSGDRSFWVTPCKAFVFSITGRKIDGKKKVLFRKEKYSLSLLQEWHKEANNKKASIIECNVQTVFGGSMGNQESVVSYLKGLPTFVSRSFIDYHTTSGIYEQLILQDQFRQEKDAVSSQLFKLGLVGELEKCFRIAKSSKLEFDMERWKHSAATLVVMSSLLHHRVDVYFDTSSIPLTSTSGFKKTDRYRNELELQYSKYKEPEFIYQMYNNKIDKSYSSIVPYEFDLLRPKIYVYAGIINKMLESDIRLHNRPIVLSSVTNSDKTEIRKFLKFESELLMHWKTSFGVDVFSDETRPPKEKAINAKLLESWFKNSELHTSIELKPVRLDSSLVDTKIRPEYCENEVSLYPSSEIHNELTTYLQLVGGVDSSHGLFDQAISPNRAHRWCLKEMKSRQHGDFNRFIDYDLNTRSDFLTLTTKTEMNQLKKINIPVFSLLNYNSNSVKTSPNGSSKKEFSRPKNIKTLDSSDERKLSAKLELLQNTDFIINLPEKIAFYVPKTNKPVHDTQTNRQLLKNMKMVSFNDWPKIEDIIKEFDALPQYQKIPQKARFRIKLLTLMLLSDKLTNENVRIKLIHDETRKEVYGEKRKHGLIRNVTRFKADMDDGEFGRVFTIDQVPENDFSTAGIPVLRNEALRYYDDGFYIKFPEELVKSAMQLAYVITWNCKGFS